MSTDQHSSQTTGVGPNTSPPNKNPQENLLKRFQEQFSSHPDPQAAWHDYYASLTDVEKYQIWQEYETDVVTTPADQVLQETLGEPKSHIGKPIEDEGPKTVAETKKQLLNKRFKDTKSKTKRKKYRPIMTALIAGSIVLALNYNDLAIAQVKQFISPGDNLKSPVIIDPSKDVKVSRESRIIIPKINVDVPVVYDIKSYSEEAIQDGLERGVVHYGDTALPGEPGNNVIVGHSSNNFFNSGKYKFAFVLLDKLEKGDTFNINYKGQRYVYRVIIKKVVDPNDFSVVQPTRIPTTTLITCTPPGTSWRRLVIQAEQISPTPTKEHPTAPALDTGEAEVVPGNSQSLWGRFTSWVF